MNPILAWLIRRFSTVVARSSLTNLIRLTFFAFIAEFMLARMLKLCKVTNLDTQKVGRRQAMILVVKKRPSGYNLRLSRAFVSSN